jgi:sigma-B regulation protein RsbU (phosphoserine phosphatase)
MIRAVVEEIKPLATNPGEFLTKLNSDLCSILKHADSPLLTTAFYLVADWKTGVMLYANAGHPKPLHVRRTAGQVIPLANASGKCQPALGLLEGTAYRSSEIIFSPGDLVMLYTDGLVEGQNQKGELYSTQMLLGAIQRRLQLPAPRLFDDLLQEVLAFTEDAAFADDVCLVGMDVAGLK